MSTTPTLTAYEKNQAFNPLVAWAHSIRWRHLTRLIDALPDPSRGQAPLKVVDIGCAHAKAFAVLQARRPIDYLGVEPDPTFAAVARERYGGLAHFNLLEGSITEHLSALDGADVVLALETLEHIPEHQVVRIVERVAQARPRLFLCSVPNEIGPIVWLKNLSSWAMGYRRHREYTWAETWHAGLGNLDRLRPHTTGHRGFDWRWLAQTLRHQMTIGTTLASPWRWWPLALSVSVFFVCRPRQAVVAEVKRRKA